MRTGLCASSLLIASLIFSSCTEKARPPWPGGKPEVDTIKVRENVATVPAEVTNRTRVSKSQLAFPADMAGEVMANWPTGKVIVGSPATDLEARRNNPFGFLRKVSGTRVEGNEVIVDTEPALLDDVVTGQFRRNIDLNSAPALELPEGTDLSAYDVQQSFGEGQPFPVGLGWEGGPKQDTQPAQQQQPLLDGPQLPLFGTSRQAVSIGGPTFSVPATPLTFINVNKSLRVAGSPNLGVDLVGRAIITPVLEFTPAVTIDYDVGLLSGPQSFEFSMSGNMKFGADYDLAYRVEPYGPITLPQINLLLGGLPNNPFHESNLKPIGKPIVKMGTIGPVPVVITTGAYLECTTEFTGAVGARGGFRASINPTLGARWHKGDGWTSISAFPLTTPTVTGDLLSGGGSATLDCGLIVRSTLLVAGAAGPYAQIRGDVVPHVDYSETCPPAASDPAARDHAGEAKVTLGVKAYTALQVGVAIDVMKVIRLEAGPWNVYRKDFRSGTAVVTDNPNYVPGCDFPTFCPPKQLTTYPWLDLVTYPLGRPVVGRGTPTSGVWCEVPCDDQQKNGAETDVDCGGAGTCQRCVKNQQCLAGSDCLSGVCGGNGLCVASACEDGVKSQQETYVDCGGPTCPACQFLTEPGPTCESDRDCAISFCSNDGVSPKRCTRNLCRDGRVTGTEADVDCGASEGCTALCAVGKHCSTASDCASGACHATTGLCVADTCVDGAKTGDEADVDCGGGCQAKCGLAQQCNYTQRGDADCASGICSTPPYYGAPGQCVANTCQDLRVDGDEVGVDCSGSCPSKCGIGSTCRFGQNDCVTSAVCSATTRRCEPPGCGDGLRNGSESSIDCGGATCLKCALSKTCNVDADCTSSVCSGGRCVGSVCENGAKDPGETDVDCGGTCSVKCATGLACAQPSDCASNLCVGNRCISDPCQDRVRNGAESDADCGGTVCTARCAAGKRCTANGDCASSLCNTTAQTCVAGPCDDGLLTAGSESDIDCGGSCGATTASKRCAVNQRCTGATDCASGSCNLTTQRCVTDACFDGVKNGSETDLDCGGACDPKCGATRVCLANADCQSGACVSGRCAADQCSDARVNGNETGVDCGGQCATKCPVGQGCLSGADCANPQMLQGVNGYCALSTATYSSSSCTTGLKDGDETGVDCGGTCSTRCAVGEGCNANADCATNICNTTTHLCVASLCQNGIRDQDETDLDCGGEACPYSCTVGQACAKGYHCNTQYCGGTNLCIPRVPSTCADAYAMMNPPRTNGMYVIDPDGPWQRNSAYGMRQPYSTWCHMQDDAVPGGTGGWTPVVYANSYWGTSDPRLYGVFRNSQDVMSREQCSTTYNQTCSSSSPGNTCLNDVGGSPCTSPNVGSCHCLGNGNMSVLYAPSLHGAPINFSGSSVAVEDALAFNQQINAGVRNEGMPAEHFRWQAFRGGVLVFDSGDFVMRPPNSPGNPTPWTVNGQWRLGADYGFGSWSQSYGDASTWNYCAQSPSGAPESYPYNMSSLASYPYNDDPGNVAWPTRTGWCRRFGLNMQRAISSGSLPADISLGWVHRFLPGSVNGLTPQYVSYVGLWFASYGHTTNPYQWTNDVNNANNAVQPPPQNLYMGLCNGMSMGTNDGTRGTPCTAYTHVSSASFSYGTGETSDITKGSQFAAGVPGLVFVLWAK